MQRMEIQTERTDGRCFGAKQWCANEDEQGLKKGGGGRRRVQKHGGSTGRGCGAGCREVR